MRGMVDLALSRMRTAATAIAILLALAPIAAAEDLSAGDQQQHGGWVFEVTPYFWLPETHGTITVRDRSADLDIDFGDVFDLLGDGNLIGGMGHLEARKDRLALFVDSMGVVIDNDAHGKILRDRVDVDVKVDFNMAILELGAVYRLLEHDRTAFTGYRVYDLDFENGAGGTKRAIDVQLRGPALGMTFTF